MQVRAAATASPHLAGAVTVALAAAGAFSWLPCHLIRAIIRLGLQDGAVRALPPLALGRVGAGSADRRLSRPQLLRFWGALRKAEAWGLAASWAVST